MKTPSANEITTAYLSNLAAVAAIVAESLERLALRAADGDFTPADAVVILRENLRTLETAAEFVAVEPGADDKNNPVKGSAAPTMPRECDGKGTRTGAAVITREHRSLMRNASEGGLPQ
jgi:hypothetical protein